MSAKDLDPTLLAGALLGHWRIAKILGEGGMGRVYLAEHAAIGRKVALKVLRKSLARSPELVERFFAEAHAVNRIRHPGIVEVTDCFIADDGTPCIVMELLIGKTVTEEMASTRIHPTRVAQIGAEVALALDAAHKAGVIHRDLKPDNLFLVEPERAGDLPTVKVLDFGVAKLMDPMPNSTVHTVAGSIMGTPDYMAPEQLAGKPVDARADIYALGASLYHACTGRPPFPASNFGDLVVMHMTKPPTPPTCFANLPAVLEQVLLAMLEKDPARRPQTMGDVALLLRSAQKLGANISMAPRSALVAQASTLAPRLLPERAGGHSEHREHREHRERTGTEAFLAPLAVHGDAAVAEGRRLPVVDGEVSGPVILGELLANARSIVGADLADAMPGSSSARALTPSTPRPAAPFATPFATPARALRNDDGEARGVLLDEQSGWLAPSGTLLLGSAEAPEVTDDHAQAASPSSRIADAAPPMRQLAPPSATPMWAWAALGAVLCFAALGTAWSVGQDVNVARSSAATKSAVAKGTLAKSAHTRSAAPRDDVDPYAALGGLAVLDGPRDGNAIDDAAIDDDEGHMRSDAPALASAVDLTTRVEPKRASTTSKLKKKPVLRAPPMRELAPTSKERRRAVLDPFAEERR